MDLDLASPNDRHLKKVLFDLKGAHDNGLLLQIHPSFSDGHREIKKLRFTHCSFSENCILAVSDTIGNVYIIDLEMQKYWQIPNRGTVSAISFPSGVKSKLLICLSTGVVQIINIETGKVIGVLMGHSYPVKEVSFSYNGKYCLTSNSSEAIIWNITSCTQAHKLSLKENMSLKKAVFMPVDSSIFACFHDDAMHIWKFGSFQCVKQIIPEGWKTHHLKSMAFTRNGRGMVIGGCTSSLIVFCLDTWSVKKIIELPDNIQGVRFMEFVPQPFDGGSNKILGIITNSSELCFVDIESSFFVNDVPFVEKLVAYFCVTPTGKYLASVTTAGEVNVYVTQKMFDSEGIRFSTGYIERVPSASKSPPDMDVKKVKRKQKWAEALNAVHDEIKEELNLKKLLPILKQFGEYPETYRVVIWRTILELPANQDAFVSLANRECHRSYVHLDEKYPLVNKSLCNALKRVLSALAYWCPLFGEVTFLPEFVFPFVKLFHCDPFVCFEAVATIIVNWCQNWFEFYPFPPVNILSMIENVLGHHDPELLEYYLNKKITSCFYSCILMQTAFSEVLPKKDWLRLWDHVLSNEPAFFFMAIVAYNVVCRNAIKKCENSDKVEAFFHTQSAVDVKLLISRSYHLLEKTPPDVHPRRYLTPFSPLKKGDAYAPYEAYPKLILDRNAAKLRDIRKEEETILLEQRKTIAMKKELEKRLRRNEKLEFQEEVMTELDRRFRDVVNAEEERISMQRKKLQNLRRELRLKELSVLEEMRDQIRRKQSQRKENQIQILMKDIAARKAREQTEVEALEEDIRKYHASLLLRKHQLQMDLGFESRDRSDELSEYLRKEDDKLKKELNELQDEFARSHDEKTVDISDKIANVTDLLRRIEIDMCEELMSKETDSRFHRNRLEIENLWRETKLLEEKFARLFVNKSIPKPRRPRKPRDDVLSAISEEKTVSTTVKSSESDDEATNPAARVRGLGFRVQDPLTKTTSYWEAADSDEELPRKKPTARNSDLGKAGVRLKSKFTERRRSGDNHGDSKDRLKLRNELKAWLGNDSDESLRGEESFRVTSARKKRNHGATGDGKAMVTGFVLSSDDAVNSRGPSDSSPRGNGSSDSALKTALYERRRLVEEAKRREMGDKRTGAR